jgi:hypothetical protein
MNRRDTVRDLIVFSLLLAIGVAGRWAQPDWNFTPLAAVAAIGSYYFASLGAAVLLPVCVLAVSDLALSAHDSWAVLLSVQVMMLLPVLMGRLARRTHGWRLAGLGALTGIVPATAFFVVTNFVHWASTSMYEKTWAGLMTCYAAGVPFYRSMLAGDVFYLTLLVGCLAVATMAVPQASRVRV